MYYASMERGFTLLPKVNRKLSDANAEVFVSVIPWTGTSYLEGFCDHILQSAYTDASGPHIVQVSFDWSCVQVVIEDRWRAIVALGRLALTALSLCKRSWMPPCSSDHCSLSNTSYFAIC